MAKILVAEDEPALLTFVERVLRREGHEVITTGDGNEAAGLLANYDPDLLVADVLLPNRSGLEVARERWKLDPGFPVLFVSGLSIHDLQRAGVPAGAILQKPFTPSQFAQRVRELLSRS